MKKNMRKIIFRDFPIIDREEEERYLLERVKSGSSQILFIYGPKSSGKTTLIEYIVEEKLKKDRKFYVNYINFRGYAIVNYSSFLNIYFQKIEDENKPWIAKAKEKFLINFGRIKGEITLPYEGMKIGLNLDLFEKVQKNEVDPFDVLFETLRRLKSKGKQPVLIIDEVQELNDIYMNGDIQKRYLLTEFFKFLIRLTKETHLAHVFVVTSSSVFIDEIYNNSKLAQTSEFYLIDHFNYDTTKEWLKEEGFNEKDIELIWEYLGGCPYNIINMLVKRKIFKDNFNLKEYLKDQALEMRGKISFTISRELKTKEEREYFLKILREIIMKGYKIKEDGKEIEEKVLEKGIEKDILFLKAKEGKIIFNSQIMKKGAEVYLGLV